MSENRIPSKIVVHAVENNKLFFRYQSFIIQARSEMLRLDVQPHRRDLPQVCSLCNRNQDYSVKVV